MEDINSRSKIYPQGDPLNYRIGERIGKMGVEKIYDRALHGLTGRLRLVKDQNGNILNSKIERNPQVGHDLILTLHFDLQQRLEQQLDQVIHNASSTSTDDGVKEAGGAIVVMNVQTGALLAAVSAPRFDIQTISHPTKEQWNTIISNPKRPLFNRVTQMAIAPGSVFKTISAVALLQSQRIDPDANFYCQGYLDKPNAHRCYIYRHFGIGHYDVSLKDALSQSCNVYFFDAASKLGPLPFLFAATQFGFGKPTGIDLPGEVGGNLPETPNKQSFANAKSLANQRLSRQKYPGDTLGLAIGQAKLTVTPLQIVRMMAAIANGGFLVTPHVVQGTGPRILGENGDRRINISPYQQPHRITTVTNENLERIREGLDRVVSHPRGTGYKTVRLKEISIAGKTGTAEVGGNKKDHAWFAGYAPSDSPKYAFVVVLEHAGSGGKAAGPVAKSLIQTMLQLKILSPNNK